MNHTIASQPVPDESDTGRMIHLLLKKKGRRINFFSLISGLQSWTVGLLVGIWRKKMGLNIPDRKYCRRCVTYSH